MTCTSTTLKKICSDQVTNPEPSLYRLANFADILMLRSDVNPRLAYGPGLPYSFWHRCCSLCCSGDLLSANLDNFKLEWEKRHRGGREMRLQPTFGFKNTSDASELGVCVVLSNCSLKRGIRCDSASARFCCRSLGDFAWSLHQFLSLQCRLQQCLFTTLVPWAMRQGTA